MNGTLSTLMNAISEAQQLVDEAEDARDRFLEPILTILCATGGGIRTFTTYNGQVYLERTGSCRGCEWNDDYRFPLSIFTADDPVTAAAKYMEDKAKQDSDAKRAAKVAQLEALQKELL